MSETLAAIAPDLPTSPSWVTTTCADCTGDVFKYYLYADWTTWQTWAYQVAQPEDYSVTDEETANEQKFSAFILAVACTTVDDGDACIFKSSTNGALAFQAITTNAAAQTLRINAADFTSVFVSASLSTDQATTYNGVGTIMADSIVASGSPSGAMEYMDYAKCTTATGVHTCHLYQPDWRANTDGSLNTSDGYPRLGLDETGIQVGYLDGGKTALAVFEDITLEGAMTLAAGCATMILTAF